MVSYFYIAVFVSRAVLLVGVIVLFGLSLSLSSLS